MSQGQIRQCVQLSSCGGSRHRRCPHTSTTDSGPARIAVYIASCTHGVAASAVGPKFVGPASHYIDTIRTVYRTAALAIPARSCVSQGAHGVAASAVRLNSWGLHPDHRCAQGSVHPLVNLLHQQCLIQLTESPDVGHEWNV